MNVYLVHTLCRRVLHDTEFRGMILEGSVANFRWAAVLYMICP